MRGVPRLMHNDCGALMMNFELQVDQALGQVPSCNQTSGSFHQSGTSSEHTPGPWVSPRPMQFHMRLPRQTSRSRSFEDAFRNDAHAQPDAMWRLGLFLTVRTAEAAWSSIRPIAVITQPDITASAYFRFYLLQLGLSFFTFTSVFRSHIPNSTYFHSSTSSNYISR
jgi:hypothetical protein